LFDNDEYVVYVWGLLINFLYVLLHYGRLGIKIHSNLLQRKEYLADAKQDARGGFE
jgi:hypothetical protein